MVKNSRVVSFSKGARGVVVYRNLVPCVELTEIFRSIQHSHNLEIAQESLRRLVTIDLNCRELGSTWQGSVDIIREAVGTYLVSKHAVTLIHRRKSAIAIHTGPGSSRTTLAHLIRAYRAAVDLGLCSVHPLLNSGKSYFRVDDHYRHSPNYVVDNDSLPEFLRELAQRAGWSVREIAILELMMCTGARISEICHLTWEGMAQYQARGEIGLRTKGQGRRLAKTGVLTAEAQGALQRYLTDMRPAQDPWLLAREPLKARWSADRHLNRLISCGENPAAHPVFFTHQRTAYNSDAFRVYWNRLQRLNIAGQRFPIVRRPHEIRHWYINRALKEIEQQCASDEYRHVIALLNFVREMGWKSWRSLESYDYRRVATIVLRRYHDRAIQQKQAVIHPDAVLSSSISTILTQGIGIDAERS